MRKGFTLVEIVIVIIIVGILAAIGLIQYNRVIEKERGVEARVILGNLKSAEIANFHELGVYATVANLSLSAPVSCAQTTHYFSYTCDAGTGTCTANRCQGLTGKQPGGTVVWNKSLTVAGVWGGTVGY